MLCHKSLWYMDPLRRIMTSSSTGRRMLMGGVYPGNAIQSQKAVFAYYTTSKYWLPALHLSVFIVSPLSFMEVDSSCITYPWAQCVSSLFFLFFVLSWNITVPTVDVGWWFHILVILIYNRDKKTSWRIYKQCQSDSHVPSMYSVFFYQHIRYHLRS